MLLVGDVALIAKVSTSEHNSIITSSTLRKSMCDLQIIGSAEVLELLLKVLNCFAVKVRS